MVENVFLDFLMKEGVETWNLSRISEDSPPDFSDCDFVEAFDYTGRAFAFPLSRIPLPHVIFVSANLNGANLFGADLEEANFFAANLENINLGETILKGADLSSSNMRGASLVGADLSGANLQRADLSGAQLRHCNVSGANFVDAEMAGANFAGTELWKAAIGDSREVSLNLVVDDGPGSEPATSIFEIIERIKELEKLYGDSEDDDSIELYFRGEPSCGLKLKPSVMRCGFKPFESDMLTELISRRPQDFNQTGYALADWVLAQHHALRTRFLDLTKNPLVALYFACQPGKITKCNTSLSGRIHVFAVKNTMVKPFNSDSVSIVSNFAKLSFRDKLALLGEERDPDTGDMLLKDSYESAMNRLLQLIRTEKPYFDNWVDPSIFFRVFVVNPQHYPERIKAQSGAFLASAFHERFERCEVESRVKEAEAFNWNDKIPIYGHHLLEIPDGSKRSIIDDLKRLNITKEALFPGLDESAIAIMENYS